MPRDTVLEQEIALLPAMKPEDPPVPASDDVLRVLEDGRRTLSRRRNWRKVGDFSFWRLLFQSADATCVFLTLRRVSQPNAPINEAARYLMRALPAPSANDMAWASLFRFNDAPSTTHADVLALFDRAIAARRAEIAA